MSSLLLYNDGACDENVVWQKLEMSRMFAWSWCKDTQQPFRHVAIVLYFDGHPCYTINFQTVDGANKIDAAVGEAEGLIVIKVAPPTGYQYFKALEEFHVTTPHGKEIAKNRISFLIHYNPGNYNLIANNCRDHVKGVVERILGTPSSDSDFREIMDNILSEDILWAMGVATAAGIGVGAIAAAVVHRRGRDSRNSGN